LRIEAKFFSDLFVVIVLRSLLWFLCLDVMLDGTPNLRMSSLPIEVRQNEAFATHSQERIMGLLGSMIPPRDKVSEREFSFTECVHTVCSVLFILCRHIFGSWDII
jgi:hypothetical protein